MTITRLPFAHSSPAPGHERKAEAADRAWRDGPQRGKPSPVDAPSEEATGYASLSYSCRVLLKKQDPAGYAKLKRAHESAIAKLNADLHTAPTLEARQAIREQLAALNSPPTPQPPDAA